MPACGVRRCRPISAGNAAGAPPASRQRPQALIALARLRRIVMPGHPHVIIHRGRSGQPVFRDSADRETYRASLIEAARTARVAVHAYALLPTEVRLLVSPESEGGLADLMQAVGRRYVRSFNQKYLCTGTPWEGRFRSAVIEAGPLFLPCMRFVEGSAGIYSRADDAVLQPEWTSAGHHVGARVDSLVIDHPAFWALGNTPFDREAAYRRFIERPVVDSEVAAILHAALNGWALGSAKFAAIVGERTGRRSQRAARGRPRKEGSAI